MTILAIETTAAVASAAIWRDGAVAASLHADAGLRHAETVLPLIQRLLQEQETALEEVDAFAVDIGPGSFTGVRIGVCIANGLAYAAKDGLKILGNGEITKKLTVKAAVFSASAKEKIEAAGGKCEVV